MKGMLFAALCAGGAMLAAAAGVSAQNGDILQKAINTPSIAYAVYGPAQKTKVVKAEVPGGQAMQIDVQAKGANAWTVGASSPIAKGIARGDRIVLAFWARAPKLAGDATTSITFAGITGTAAPFAQVIGGPVTVGRAWTLQQVTGVAPANAAAGTVQVTLHLAADKALLELGPVFVLDMGQAG